MSFSFIKAGESGSYRVDWKVPHVEPIRSTQERLYAGKNVRFYPDAQAIENSVYNLNTIEASTEILRNWVEGDGRLFFVFAPMWGGKSATASIVAEQLRGSVQVFQHVYGFRRTNSMNMAFKGEGDCWNQTGIWAETFDTFHELMGQVEGRTGDVVIADEIQFSQLEEDELFFWKRWLGENDMRAILFGLDLTYRGTAWENTQNIIDAADAGAVLAARCTDCGETAWMTRRIVVLDDGRERPACENDPTVLVGAGKDGISGDYYKAACSKHFALLTQEEARRFDRDSF